MRQCLNNKAGLMLVEVVVSLAIFGIVVAPLTYLFTGSVRTNALARKQLQANQLAQKYMEEYKGKSFAELAGMKGTNRPGDGIKVEVAALDGAFDYKSEKLSIADFALFWHGEGQGTIFYDQNNPEITITLQDDKIRIEPYGRPVQVRELIGGNAAGGTAPVRLIIEKGVLTQGQQKVRLNVNNDYSSSGRELEVYSANFATDTQIQIITGSNVSLKDIALLDPQEEHYKKIGLIITVTIIDENDKVLTELQQIKKID